MKDWSELQLYGIKSCDTCRKALKELPEIAFVDLRETGIPEEILNRAIDTFGDKLLNKRSLTWRKLSEAEREMPIKALLEAHPLVMKRPLIAQNAHLLLGWGPETRAALGLAG